MKLSPAKTFLTAITLPLATSLAPALAVTVDPGQIGYPSLITTFNTDPTLADITYQANVYTSDVGTTETFESRVTRGSDGSLTFWYLTTNPTEPAAITLVGFAGLTTNVQQAVVDPFDPTRLIQLPLAGRVIRSADGNTLGFDAWLPIDGPMPDRTTMSIYAVTTNATSFQLSDTGYQLDFGVDPYAPPEFQGPPGSVLSTQPRPAFIPAIPEPLSLMTLPLALFALCFRSRRLVSAM